MKTFTTLLAATTALAFTAPAFANDASAKTETSIEHDDDGGYERNSTTERNTRGGSVSTEKNVELDVKNDGSREKTTTTKQVHDPKGMFNKDTAKTKTTETRDKHGNRTIESERTVNGKTVSETKKSM